MINSDKINDNYIQANDLNNLVCLCRQCHIEIENEFRDVEKLLNGGQNS